jgi:hypothetical protein
VDSNPVTGTPVFSMSCYFFLPPRRLSVSLNSRRILTRRANSTTWTSDSMRCFTGSRVWRWYRRVRPSLRSRPSLK